LVGTWFVNVEDAKLKRNFEIILEGPA